MPSASVLGYGSRFSAITAGASQKISFTNVSAQSTTTMLPLTSIVRLFSTEDCWILFGDNPTAAANDGNSFFLPAGIVEYFGADPGQKIAVIRDSANGDLHVTQGKGQQ